MKNHFKKARAIILLPLLALTLQANQSKTLSYSYYKNVEERHHHIITIKGKNSSCSVRLPDVSNTLYKTDCIEKLNSKGIHIFSPKDKSVYKTLAEISYFKITKRDLKSKKPIKIPFIGSRKFNFIGVSATEQTIKILANKEVVYTLNGVTWRGKFSDPKKNPYWVEKDVICSYENGRLSICTELHQVK